MKENQTRKNPKTKEKYNQTKYTQEQNNKTTVETQMLRVGIKQCQMEVYFKTVKEGGRETRWYQYDEPTEKLRDDMSD